MSYRIQSVARPRPQLSGTGTTVRRVLIGVGVASFALIMYANWRYVRGDLSDSPAR